SVKETGNSQFWNYPRYANTNGNTTIWPLRQYLNVMRSYWKLRKICLPMGDL
ncbi:hypothetical protein SK128_010930, partial [Halocaridina rubra]